MSVGLLPSLQARVRQLFGVRGGPLVGAADFVQPVALVASSEGRFRNPASELGEGIGRSFVASAPATIVALNFGVVQIQPADQNTLIHVRRVGVNVDGSTCRILIGRTTRVTSANMAVAALGNFTDTRLGINALGSAGAMRLEAGATAAGVAPAYLGHQELQPPVNTTQWLDVDYVLLSNVVSPGLFDGALVVSAATSATAFRAWFEGELHTFGER